MRARVGDGRHHVEGIGEFVASRSSFFPELEVFARGTHENCYPYYLHDRWQLTWILSGKVDLAHHGGSHLLHAGDAILVAPFEAVAGRLHEHTPFGFATLQIPGHLISAIRRESNTSGRVIARHDGAALCETLITQLIEANSGEAQRMAIDEALMMFHARQSLCTELTARSARSHPVVSRACSIMDSTIEEGLPLTELAAAFRLNHRYVISLFNAELGLTPHQYLMMRRLDCARSMVNQGHALHNVAAAAGYNDQSHLTRNFKRAFDVTPGAYQARHCYMNSLLTFPHVSE
jgi:AraC-like DNA-binding protein